MKIIIFLLIHTAACFRWKFPWQSTSIKPAILSLDYGYDDCIGGVNNFDTEEEYIQEMIRRNCSVVEGPDGSLIHNVFAANLLKARCGQPFNHELEWTDGMPMVFNYPLVETPAKETIQIELSDGTVKSPACVMLAPANEDNEMDTLLTLGQFGDGRRGTVYPVRVSIVDKLILAGPEGELDANGISYSDLKDTQYTSSVRMVYAKMWDVKEFDEGDKYPNWPLPSNVYPNTCKSLYSSTTHVLRVAFSGGATYDGVTAVSPQEKEIFSLKTLSSSVEIAYLGLADLGKTVSVPEGERYQEDGDNYLDICLDLTHQPEVMMEDIVLDLHCDPEGVALYPPKGRPYACESAQVTLTEGEAWSYYSKVWVYKPASSFSPLCFFLPHRC